ncbi:hypothetical protein LTS03_011273 [Exophiala xenobiotica]|nr:hypothetical protein LTR72_011757 [Exophiala xenobiotica]KAK5243199.1 hypothetical protein LTS06_010981 [Exophiala xenobiotica]KAK5284572.1 hypothetical protein LTR14_011660 [Exophiala xenobiotica]KAK5332620.1 hypothetical protein LTR98_011251 [Exophiala xenobiotica]KAK5358456.1 hypothetical protein LTS03_011273 [Exophiala xenobiotica]
MQINLATQCSQLVAPTVPGATILHISTAEVHNFSFPEVAIFGSPPVSDLDFCNINISLRHIGADDTVYINVWLPLKDWNGRYQATGGGGLAAGMGELMLAGQVANGGLWALADDGSLDETLQLNFAWRSIHDMSVTSKDIIKQFYGTKPHYSYWNGCSQGGRQGYAAAAKYPHEFDGILATAPAIDFTEMIPSDFYPPIVMRNSEIPPECIFPEYQRAIIAACDALDGVEDGLISDHESFNKCSFNPDTLVRRTITCGKGCTEPDKMLEWKKVSCRTSSELVITSTHADIIRKILAGPHTTDGKRLWYGLAPGAEFDALARVIPLGNGTHEVAPFEVAESYLKYIVMQDATYDMATMTFEDYGSIPAVLVTARSALGEPGTRLERV